MPGHGNAINSDLVKTYYVDGTEGRLFVEFCAKYNCTLMLLPAEDWGKTYANGSGEGMLGSVRYRYADACVSALYVDW